jgi:hypothetical protein
VTRIEGSALGNYEFTVPCSKTCGSCKLMILKACQDTIKKACVDFVEVEVVKRADLLKDLEREKELVRKLEMENLGLRKRLCLPLVVPDHYHVQACADVVASLKAKAD